VAAATYSIILMEYFSSLFADITEPSSLGKFFGVLIGMQIEKVRGTWDAKMEGASPNQYRLSLIELP